MITPVDYFFEVEADLNRMWEEHSIAFESILHSNEYESLMFTYESDNKPEEKQGIISRLIASIKSFLNSIIEKIGNIGKGGKIDPSKKNEQVQIDKDPKLVMQFLNGDIKSSKEYLQKAARGEISAEEAQAFVNKQNNAFGTIKSVSLPAIAIAAGAAANQLFLKKWRAEATEALDNVERSTKSDFAGKVANTYDKNGKKTEVDEATKIILAHINQDTKKGLDYILGPIKSLYQKGIIAQTIHDDAEKRSDPKFKRAQKIEGIKTAVRGSIDAFNITRDRKTRDANSNLHSKNQDTRYKAKNKVQRAMNRAYDDVDGYVDNNALNNKRKNKK